MAPAPGHLLGQIIGTALEQSIEPILRDVADFHNLYLDREGTRSARQGRTKVRWVDGKGNSHNLDFVLERGGTEECVGVPVAFVESAWRRYTKHSRAKAQEIQGALIPLREMYSASSPFLGVIVAGEWTAAALDQLRSNGFSVLHVPLAKIIESFASWRIDVNTHEDTPDEDLQKQVGIYESLADSEKRRLANSLLDPSSPDLLAFGNNLKTALSRRLESVVVLPLRGDAAKFLTIGEAIEGIRQYANQAPPVAPFVRFEIRLTYSNHDSHVATFSESRDAIDFLEQYA